MTTHIRSLSKYLGIGIAIGIGAMGGCYDGAPGDAASIGSGDDGSGVAGLDHEALVRVPVSDDGVSYVGVDQVDILPWGPTAFAVGADRTLWLADGPRRRILVYDEDTGMRRDTLILEESVGNISALVVTNAAAYVLDTGARTRLVRLDRRDGGVRIEELPDHLQLESGVTGMLLDEDGAVIVELNGGSARYQVVDANDRFVVAARELMAAGRSIRVVPGDPTGARPGEGGIEVDGAMVATISLPANLIGMRVLGGWGDGTFAVSMQELALVDGTINIDETVRKYSVDGTLIGEARLHTDQDFLMMRQRVSVGPDGEVYHAARRAEYVELQRLSFAPQPLERVLPATPMKVAPHAGLDVDVPVPVPLMVPRNYECIPAEQILANADSYANLKLNYTQDNLTGACAGRIAPKWATKPGKYTGVAYDWGGMSSVEDYTTAIASGQRAGDIPSSAQDSTTSCSVGVDCVGFLLRAWGLAPADKIYSGAFKLYPDKYQPLGSTASMVAGDGLYKNGHVMLFTGLIGDSNVPEIADANGYNHRVVRAPNDWNEVNKYKPVRYHKHCVNYCVDGGFSGPAQVDGSTVSVAGSVSAPKGLLRYSLVVDTIQPPHWSEDYQPGAVEDTFTAEFSVAGVAAGDHTLGLWVKDKNECAKLVASQKFTIEEQVDETVCGDGERDPGEQCDGSDLGGETCVSQGWQGGTLVCKPGCTFDISDCDSDIMVCGNGVREPGEDCDGGDLGGETCESQDHTGGSLGCTGSCSLDESNCTDDAPVSCGDGDIDAGEDCDGNNLGGASCGSLGWGGGALGCDGSCSFDDSACTNQPSCSYSVAPESPNSSQSAPYDCQGGVVMPISGNIDVNTGELTVKSPYKDGDFGTGTYRVFVFAPNDPASEQCKSWNMERAKKVLNQTASSLTFSAFASKLVCDGGYDDTNKAYCIAKEDGGDTAYWCSGMLEVTFQ